MWLLWLFLFMCLCLGSFIVFLLWTPRPVVVTLLHRYTQLPLFKAHGGETIQIQLEEVSTPVKIQWKKAHATTLSLIQQMKTDGEGLLIFDLPTGKYWSQVSLQVITDKQTYITQPFDLYYTYYWEKPSVLSSRYRNGMLRINLPDLTEYNILHRYNKTEWIEGHILTPVPRDPLTRPPLIDLLEVRIESDGNEALVLTAEHIPYYEVEDIYWEYDKIIRSSQNLDEIQNILSVPTALKPTEDSVKKLLVATSEVIRVETTSSKDEHFTNFLVTVHPGDAVTLISFLEHRFYILDDYVESSQDATIGSTPPNVPNSEQPIVIVSLSTPVRPGSFYTFTLWPSHTLTSVDFGPLSSVVSYDLLTIQHYIHFSDSNICGTVTFEGGHTQIIQVNLLDLPREGGIPHIYLYSYIRDQTEQRALWSATELFVPETHAYHKWLWSGEATTAITLSTTSSSSWDVSQPDHIKYTPQEPQTESVIFDVFVNQLFITSILIPKVQVFMLWFQQKQLSLPTMSEDHLYTLDFSSPLLPGDINLLSIFQGDHIETHAYSDAYRQRFRFRMSLLKDQPLQLVFKRNNTIETIMIPVETKNLVVSGRQRFRVVHHLQTNKEGQCGSFEAHVATFVELVPTGYSSDSPFQLYIQNKPVTLQKDRYLQCVESTTVTWFRFLLASSGAYYIQVKDDSGSWLYLTPQDKGVYTLTTTEGIFVPYIYP